MEKHYSFKETLVAVPMTENQLRTVVRRRSERSTVVPKLPLRQKRNYGKKLVFSETDILILKEYVEELRLWKKGPGSMRLRSKLRSIPKKRKK